MAANVEPDTSKPGRTNCWKIVLATDEMTSKGDQHQVSLAYDSM